MEITAYSIIMSVICSDIFVIILYCLRRKKILVKNYGIILLMALYLLTAVRMFVPFEFSFTRGINFGVYNPVRETLIKPIIEGKIAVKDLLTAIWGAGAAFCLIKYLYTYRKAVSIVQKCSVMDDPGALDILNKVNKKYGKNIRVTCRCSKNIPVPMGFGIFHKAILLPKREYDPKELYYVIAHECNHFYNHDLLVKMAIKVFCCVFWWNPVAYFLYDDVESILEMRCDYSVCKRMSHSEIGEYIMTIIQEVKRMLSCGENKNYKYVGGIAFLKDNRRSIVKERVEMLAQWPVKSSGALLAGIVGGFVVLTLLSYVFVCQPAYPVPAHGENGDPYYTGEQLEVYEEENGEYRVQIEGTDEIFNVPEEYIEMILDDGAHFKGE